MDTDNRLRQKLILPTLRGKMGDWFYYVTLLPFKEVANRVVFDTKTVHHSHKLDDGKMTQITFEIVDYLKKQEQRFFNSLILGIYDGSPTWQEIDILGNQNVYEDFSEDSLDYLSRTFGILTLNGNEKIFVIEGQHKVQAIKEAVKQEKILANEEIAAIFVAHKETPEGKMRTKQLVSNLNQYSHL